MKVNVFLNEENQMTTCEIKISKSNKINNDTGKIPEIIIMQLTKIRIIKSAYC